MVISKCHSRPIWRTTSHASLNIGHTGGNQLSLGSRMTEHELRIDLRQPMQGHRGQMKCKQDPLPLSPFPRIHS